MTQSKRFQIVVEGRKLMVGDEVKNRHGREWNRVDSIDENLTAHCTGLTTGQKIEGFTGHMEQNIRLDAWEVR